jgi:hypothetical protein
VAAPSAVLSKLRLQLYGFVEFDAIQDSTQSYSELAGNALITRPGTQGEKHGRTMFGVRIEGPSSGCLRTSGMLEMDWVTSPAARPRSGKDPTFSRQDPGDEA